MWLSYDQLPQSQGHVFYEQLQKLLRQEEFDTFLEKLCAPFYAEKSGRRSIPPGRYFRMLLTGYFEGIDSERSICWRRSDSLSLRDFLGSGHRRLDYGGECGHEEHCTPRYGRDLSGNARTSGQRERHTNAGQGPGLVNFDRKRRGRLRRHGGLEARDAVYGNRARLKSEKGKALLRARGELVERSLAHFLDRGGMGFRLARINEFHRKYLPGGKAGQVLFAGQKAEVQPILWVLRVEWQLLRGSRW